MLDNMKQGMACEENAKHVVKKLERWGFLDYMDEDFNILSDEVGEKTKKLFDKEIYPTIKLFIDKGLLQYMQQVRQNIGKNKRDI